MSAGVEVFETLFWKMLLCVSRWPSTQMKGKTTASHLCSSCSSSES